MKKRLVLFPKLKALLLFIGFSLLFNFKEETSQAKQWYKGNLHAHSYWSDGDDFPEMVISWYKENGYNFIELTEHNTLAEGKRRVNNKRGRLSQVGFDNYLKKFGKEWVSFNNDSSVLKVDLKTFAEYKKMLEIKGEFLILQAEEVTDDYSGTPIHLNACNIKRQINPAKGNGIADVVQRNIYLVNEQSKEFGVPMLTILNHPNYHYAISANDIVTLNNLRFFELFNGHPDVNNMGDSLHIGTEEMWDIVNKSYIENGKPLLYGVATDDSHHFHSFGSEFKNPGRGWVMVNADFLVESSLLQAMNSGDFYSSTGVELENIGFDGKNLNIVVKKEQNVDYEIQFIGLKKGAEKAVILKKGNTVRASFQLSDNILFVRAKVISNKIMNNPIRQGEFETAWVQPITSESKIW